MVDDNGNARSEGAAADPGLAMHFRALARYARIANERMYAACAELPDDVLTRPTSASLGSILAILEHLLVADRIWLERLRGGGGETPTRGLREPTFAALSPLRREREELDGEIEAHFAAVDDADLAGVVRFVDGAGREARDPVPLAAAHMFNHQTHHRGQIHVLLREVRPKSLTLDMHRILNPFR